MLRHMYYAHKGCSKLLITEPIHFLPLRIENVPLKLEIGHIKNMFKG